MNPSIATKVSKLKISKPKKVVEPTVVVDAVVVEQTVVDADADVVVDQAVVEVSFKERMEVLIRSKRAQIDVLKAEVSELQKLQRYHELVLKAASKKQKKKPVRDYSKVRRATGFAEPLIVSDELYSFLVKTKATMKDSSFSPTSKEDEANWPKLQVKTGVPVARTDVTSHINQYIKNNNLQNPEFRREIVPDAALKKLFSEPTEFADSEDPQSRKIYTYLKLQKYLNHHYAKKPVAQ